MYVCRSLVAKGSMAQTRCRACCRRFEAHLSIRVACFHAFDESVRRLIPISLEPPPFVLVRPRPRDVDALHGCGQSILDATDFHHGQSGAKLSMPQRCSGVSDSADVGGPEGRSKQGAAAGSAGSSLHRRRERAGGCQTANTTQRLFLFLTSTMHMVARKELGRAGHYNSVPVAGC